MTSLRRYAANGGWGAAISANTTPEKQKALAEFFLWASSQEQSDQYVIPNSTLPWYEINGQDPWRKSHLDIDKWVAQGFDRDLSKQYVESILSNLVSKNLAVEARFPKAGEIMSVLDEEVYKYLIRVHEGKITEQDKQRERLRTAQRITDRWNQIINEYNSRGDTSVPILEIYQRLRGVYVPNEQNHHLEYIRSVGYVLMAIIIFSSVGSAAWVVHKRNATVVKVSQPLFLGLICLGTLVMGSSIFVLGVDDQDWSQRACDRACMATPWLFAIGFSVCFAALFSKIWRLNILMKSAKRFRRITVTVMDVMLPFVSLLLLNVASLLTWTIADPLIWTRVRKGRTESGELESYGHCQSSGSIAAVMLGLVGGVNIVALALANIQAYLTRNLHVAYDESRYIGLAMASILQAFMIGVPLLFLADDNPTARYVVRSVLVFVICIAVLGFVFVPKMTQKKEPETNRFSSHFVTDGRRNDGSLFMYDNRSAGSVFQNGRQPQVGLGGSVQPPPSSELASEDFNKLSTFSASIRGASLAELPEVPEEDQECRRSQPDDEGVTGSVDVDELGESVIQRT